MRRRWVIGRMGSYITRIIIQISRCRCRCRWRCAQNIGPRAWINRVFSSRDRIKCKFGTIFFPMSGEFASGASGINNERASNNAVRSRFRPSPMVGVLFVSFACFVACQAIRIIVVMSEFRFILFGHDKW